MKGGPSVHKRMRLVSGVYHRREERRVNRLLCEMEGIDPDQFEAEYRHWEARFTREGLFTRRDQLACVAADLGVPVEELEAVACEIAEQRRRLGG